MKFDSVIIRSDTIAGKEAARSARLHPQHLGYFSFALDFLLFVGACLASAAWVGPDSSDLFQLAQALVGALLLAVFAVCCRVARLHAPANLVSDSRFSLVAKMLGCFALPPIAALAICWPYFWSENGAVHDFILWLEWVTILAIGFGVISRSVFLLAFPTLLGHVISPHRIAIVGSGESARRLLDWIDRTAPRLVEIVGIFDDRGEDRQAGSVLAGQILGNTSDLIELYKRAPFEKVVIALPHSAEGRVLDLLRRLRQLPVDIALAPDLIGFQANDETAAEIAGLKLHSLADRPIREPQRLFKGAIDRALAAIALLFLSPLLIAVSIAIKFDSRGPIFFRQPRQGLGDTLFDVFKFRTMHQDLGDSVGRQQTKREDPRITRLGAFLRRSSIDELPSY